MANATSERTPRRQQTPRAPKPPRSGLLQSRRGTVLLAALAALGALAVLLVFMSKYRDSVDSGGDPIEVLVTKGNIDVGTPGDVIAEAELFEVSEITEDDALDGSLSDPSELAGTVVTKSLFPGQQITASDLKAGSDPVTSKLTGSQRAVSVPVTATRGNVGQIEPGSRVDVLGAEESSGQSFLVARDLLILEVPEAESADVSSDDNTAVVLRATDVEAGKIAAAESRGEIWLIVRPPTMARDTKTKTSEEAIAEGGN